MGFTSYLYLARAKRAVGGLCLATLGSHLPEGTRVHTLAAGCASCVSSSTLWWHPPLGSSWSSCRPPFHTPSPRGMQGTVLCPHSILRDVCSTPSLPHPLARAVTRQHQGGITAANRAPGARGATDRSQEELGHPLHPLPSAWCYGGPACKGKYCVFLGCIATHTPQCTQVLCTSTADLEHKN